MKPKFDKLHSTLSAGKKSSQLLEAIWASMQTPEAMAALKLFSDINPFLEKSSAFANFMKPSPHMENLMKQSSAMEAALKSSSSAYSLLEASSAFANFMKPPPHMENLMKQSSAMEAALKLSSSARSLLEASSAFANFMKPLPGMEAALKSLEGIPRDKIPAFDLEKNIAGVFDNLEKLGINRRLHEQTIAAWEWQQAAADIAEMADNQTLEQLWEPTDAEVTYVEATDLNKVAPKHDGLLAARYLLVAAILLSTSFFAAKAQSEVKPLLLQSLFFIISVCTVTAGVDNLKKFWEQVDRRNILKALWPQIRNKYPDARYPLPLAKVTSPSKKDIPVRRTSSLYSPIFGWLSHDEIVILTEQKTRDMRSIVVKIDENNLPQEIGWVHRRHLQRLDAKRSCIVRKELQTTGSEPQSD